MKNSSSSLPLPAGSELTLSLSKNRAEPGKALRAFRALLPFGRARRLEQRIAEVEASVNIKVCELSGALERYTSELESRLLKLELHLLERLETVTLTAEQVAATTDAVKRQADAFLKMLEERVQIGEANAKAFAAERIEHLELTISRTEERLALREVTSDALWLPAEAFPASLEERIQIAEAGAKAFAAGRLDLFARRADEQVAVCEAHVMAYATDAVGRLSSVITTLDQRTTRLAELIKSEQQSLLTISREAEARAKVAEAGAKAYADAGLGALGTSIGASNRAVLHLAARIDKAIQDRTGADQARSWDTLNHAAVD